jgi:hypothetical protein
MTVTIYMTESVDHTIHQAIPSPLAHASAPAGRTEASNASRRSGRPVCAEPSAIQVARALRLVWQSNLAVPRIDIKQARMLTSASFRAPVTALTSEGGRWGRLFLDSSTTTVSIMRSTKICMVLSRQCPRLPCKRTGLQATCRCLLWLSESASPNFVFPVLQDYQNWKQAKTFATQFLNAPDDGYAVKSFEATKGSFCHVPFVLDPSSKQSLLQLDASFKMHHQMRNAIFQQIVAGVATSPYLILRVHRDNLIAETLQEISYKVDELQKPLKVQFIGEEGIDDGGVQKEFFQLIVRQLFDPMYGMVTQNSDTRQYWLNADSLECNHEFELLGTILGLALYNSIILNLHFPMTLYKKLMIHPVGLADLSDTDPATARGLQQLLAFDGNVEETFCCYFAVERESFGEVKKIELKPGGSEIAVTHENKAEYVQLYVDYLLNKSIERQFVAFKRGFDKVRLSVSFALTRSDGTVSVGFLSAEGASACGSVFLVVEAWSVCAAMD